MWKFQTKNHMVSFGVVFHIRGKGFTVVVKTGKNGGEKPVGHPELEMPKWGTGQTTRPARRSRAVHWRPQPHTTREPPSWGDAGNSGHWVTRGTDFMRDGKTHLFWSSWILMDLIGLSEDVDVWCILMFRFFFQKFGRCLKIRIFFSGFGKRIHHIQGSSPLHCQSAAHWAAWAGRLEWDEFASKKARWMMAIPRKAANVRTKWKFIAGKIIYKWWM